MLVGGRPTRNRPPQAGALVRLLLVQVVTPHHRTIVFRVFYYQVHLTCAYKYLVPYRSYPVSMLPL